MKIWINRSSHVRLKGMVLKTILKKKNS